MPPRKKTSKADADGADAAEDVKGSADEPTPAAERTSPPRDEPAAATERSGDDRPAVARADAPAEDLQAADAPQGADGPVTPAAAEQEPAAAEPAAGEPEPAAAPLAPPNPPRTAPTPVVASPANATPHRPHPDHRGFYNAAGERIDDLADAFAEVSNHATVLRTTQQVVERYLLPNSQELGGRIVYAEGVNVPRPVAEALVATARQMWTDDDKA